MGALADMLAKGSDKPMAGPADDEGSGDDMGAAAVQAFFEACKAGDWAEAASHLSSAMEHCKDDGPSSGHALVLVPHGK